MSAERETIAARVTVKPERAEAFSLLRDLVAENYAAGRRSYGAWLKPELRRRTLSGFDERRLDFRSFGAFLRAGEDAGVVVVHPSPAESDPEVTPPGEAPLPRVAGPSARPDAVPESQKLLRLRALLHEAIDHMPESELLQLRLPVRYLVGDDERPSRLPVSRRRSDGSSAPGWPSEAERARSLERSKGPFVFTTRCRAGLAATPYPFPSRMVDQLEKLARLAETWRKRKGQLDGSVRNWARREEGLQIALNDGTLVDLDLHLFDHAGRTYSREPHVKVDDGTAFDQCGRIYFAIDTDPYRFIVDHVGLHLWEPVPAGR